MNGIGEELEQCFDHQQLEPAWVLPIFNSCSTSASILNFVFCISYLQFTFTNKSCSMMGCLCCSILCFVFGLWYLVFCRACICVRQEKEKKTKSLDALVNKIAQSTLLKNCCMKTTQRCSRVAKKATKAVNKLLTAMFLMFGCR